MHRAVVLGRATDQKADPAAERETFTFDFLKVALGIAERGVLQLMKSGGRQVENDHRHIAFAVLESGKTRAQPQVTGRLKADTQTLGEYRVGGRRQGEGHNANHDASPGSEEVNEQATGHGWTAFPGSRPVLTGLSRCGNGPITIQNGSVPQPRDFVTNCLAAPPGPPI